MNKIEFTAEDFKKYFLLFLRNENMESEKSVELKTQIILELIKKADAEEFRYQGDEDKFANKIIKVADALWESANKSLYSPK